MTARKGAWIAGAVGAVCVAVLLADYIIAGPKTTTAARLARKRRDNTVSWVLIAAAATFLPLVGESQARLQPSGRSRANAEPPQPVLRASPPAPAIEFSTFVAEAIAQFGRGKEAALPLLQAIQSHYRYLPDEALRLVCEQTDITPAEIAGTSSFYVRFRRSPVGEHVVRVCHGTACHVAGARQITDELRRYLTIPEGGDTDPARQFTVDEVACLGCCSLAPLIVVDGHPAGKLTPATACQAVRASV